jgi:hypothetical protein
MHVGLAQRVEHAMPLSHDPDRRAAQLANLRNAPAAPLGNRRRVSHGAFARIAPERLEAKALQVFEALAADAPVRADDGTLPAADVVAVRLLADAMCRLENIRQYLARKGWEGEDGRPRPVLEYEARLRSHVLPAAGARHDVGREGEAGP